MSPKKKARRKKPLETSSVKNEKGAPPPSLISREQLVNLFLEGYGGKKNKVSKDKFSKKLSAYLQQESKKYAIHEKYNILILYDDTTIINSDSDKIYEAIKNFSNKEKPILLILYSRGGEPGPAYLIGKLCREFCNGKLAIAVPRRAKSAATLIACAANEIHMGSLSQLGPIDPQIDGMPALGLKNSIKHIAELASKYKDAGNMFAKYMKLSIKPIQIGYYERVAESAKQYAERLLEEHRETLAGEPSLIARYLIYEYKDHGFVIDKGEATRIFGEKMIKCDTLEYEYANFIYEIINEFENYARLLDHALYFIGSLNSEPVIISKGR